MIQSPGRIVLSQLGHRQAISVRVEAQLSGHAVMGADGVSCAGTPNVGARCSKADILDLWKWLLGRFMFENRPAIEGRETLHD